jgi:hypothetical protein
LKILKISSISESPGNKGFRVHISAKMQPTDHMSTPVEYCRPPRRISGRGTRASPPTAPPPSVPEPYGTAKHTGTAYLMCISPQRHAKRSRQPEIRQLQVPVPIDQKILWLQIAMQDAMAVTVPHASTS